MVKEQQPITVRATVRPTVYIIDDDDSVRTAFNRLLLSHRIRAQCFASADDFLKADVPLDGACVIADMKMHGMSGPELQKKLVESGARVAVIFVTAFDTEEARAQAKKSGAIAYFRKPVDDQALIDAIHWALSKAEVGA